MTLSDLASSIATHTSLTYSPPSGYTYVADVCAATCGAVGIGASACGGSGSITPFAASNVWTTSITTLRSRLAALPLNQCPWFWSSTGPIALMESDWTIKCPNAATIYLSAGTFSLGGSELTIREKTSVFIIGHPSGSTLDAQTSSRIFNVEAHGQLQVENVNLINGRADYGGAVKALSALPAGRTSLGAVNYHAYCACRVLL